MWALNYSVELLLLTTMAKSAVTKRVVAFVENVTASRFLFYICGPVLHFSKEFVICIARTFSKQMYSF